MGLTHEEILVNSDPLCTIDGKTRKVTVNSGKTTFLQHDHNSERVGFTMERFIDGHDMFAVDRVAIKYLNASRNDMYIVDDLTLSEDKKSINFTWLISGNVTSNAGSVAFQINFRCWDDKGNITYNWSTQPCSTYTILEGVYSMDSNPEELYDFWAKYEAKVNYVTDTTEDVEVDLSKLIQNGNALEKQLNGLTTTSDELCKTVGELSYSVPALEGRANTLDSDIDVLESRAAVLERTLSDDQAFAINYEIGEIGTVIGKVIVEHKSNNLLDMNSEDCVRGYFITVDGEFADNESYFVSPFIKVEPGQTIAAAYNNASAIMPMRFITAYNVGKTAISESGATSAYEYLVPEGVSFVRISLMLRSDYSNYMLFFKTSDSIPKYEEYYEPYYTLVEKTDETLTESGVAADAKEVGDKISKLSAAIPSVKKHSGLITAEMLSSNTPLSFDDFPEMLKTGQVMNATASFSVFEDDDVIKLGFINDEYDIYQGYLELTKTHVKWCLGTGDVLMNEVHGLTLSDYVNIIVTISESDAKLRVVINTLNGTYVYKQTNDSTRCNAIGTLTLIGSMDMFDVVLSATCTQFRSDVWLIGDSYFGYSSRRVVGRLIEWGLSDGVLIDGLGGMNSELAYIELQKLLKFGTPKYLVWYIGMNDNATIVSEYYPLIEKLCDDNSIELIFNRVPVVAKRVNENTAINEYVLASGRRYVDSYQAVGATEEGIWYSSYLSDDGVHPSETGAAALASRLLVDVPEILSWR